jgi:hypothetical protein
MKNSAATSSKTWRRCLDDHSSNAFLADVEFDGLGDIESSHFSVHSNR